MKNDAALLRLKEHVEQQGVRLHLSPWWGGPHTHRSAVQRNLLLNAARMQVLQYQGLPGCAGLTLAEGWKAQVKARISTRRNGQPGRTSTNTYVCPAGKLYRSYAAVVQAIRGGEQQERHSGELSASP